MSHKSDVQRKSLYVLKVLETVVPELSADRQESTQPGRLAFGEILAAGVCQPCTYIPAYTAIFTVRIIRLLSLLYLLPQNLVWRVPYSTTIRFCLNVKVDGY